jgi:hypothetical protein
MNDRQRNFRSRLASLLKNSTLTPGSYVPSPAVRSGTHVAVLAGDQPVLLCGPHDDPASRAQAEAMAASPRAAAIFRSAGCHGPLAVGTVSGGAVEWRGSMAAVVGKVPGKVEDGTETGPLVAIVLADPAQALGLATVLCVTDETARALDPAAFTQGIN